MERTDVLAVLMLPDLSGNHGTGVTPSAVESTGGIQQTGPGTTTHTRPCPPQGVRTPCMRRLFVARVDDADVIPPPRRASKRLSIRRWRPDRIDAVFNQRRDDRLPPVSSTIAEFSCHVARDNSDA